MKKLIFPKDQELFQGIDENGMLLPFDGDDINTMAGSYEINIDFYRKEHTNIRASGSSEQEVELDLSSQMRLILSAQWEALEAVVENASKKAIGRFPKTQYDMYIYEDKEKHKQYSFPMMHFSELGKALNQYKKGLAPGGPLGNIFNDVEEKAGQLRGARTKRKKLLLELPVVLLQIFAALLVLFRGFQFQTGTESTEQIIKSFVFLAFLLLGLIVPVCTKIHDKNTFSGLLLHPVVLIIMVIVGWGVLGGLLVDDDIITLACRIIFFGFYGFLLLSDFWVLIKCVVLRREFRRVFPGKAQQMYRYIRLRELWWKNEHPNGKEPEGLQKLQKLFQEYLKFYR